MKEWFFTLEPKQRLYLIGGSSFAVLLILYLMVWAPVASGISKHQASIDQDRKDTAWMKSASAQLQQLKSRPGSTSRNQSLVSIVDRRINDAGLKASLKRMQPDGKTKVKLWLSQGSFDAIINLIGTLEQADGITVSNFSVSPADAPGIVDARISLARG